MNCACSHLLAPLWKILIHHLGALLEIDESYDISAKRGPVFRIAASPCVIVIKASTESDRSNIPQLNIHQQ